MLICWSGCNKSRPQGVPSGYSEQSDDMVKFFVEEMQRYGGHVKTTNVLPKLQMTWWYKVDRNGFQLLFDKTNRVDFQNFLKQAFGDPIISEEYPHILYRVQDIGTAIMCNFGTNDPLQVICLKAQAF